MTRTKLRDRILPDYTRGEEIFNMVSHIVGGGFGVIALVLSVLVAAFDGNVWGVVSCSVYGGTMILLYTMSSVYHGLKKEMPKKVMQVLDHCTIYFLIAGTYTPILLCAVRSVSPFAAWGLFAFVWGFAALGTVFTAIDLKKYGKFAMICYIGMGWCVVLAAKPTIQAIPLPGLAWLLAGGIAYTVGAVFYGFGKKCRYIHSVFHIFVVLGSILQFISILFYVILGALCVFYIRDFALPPEPCISSCSVGAASRPDSKKDKTDGEKLLRPSFNRNVFSGERGSRSPDCAGRSEPLPAGP